VRGKHKALKGKGSFGPYTLRFEIIADSNQLRLCHSFIFDGNPETDFVRASELLINSRVGKNEQFAFGADEGTETTFARQRAHWAPDFRIAELYQDSARHWQLGRRVAPDRPEIFCAEGSRADGWMALSGSKGGLAVAVRDSWQNNPKSLWADAETGQLRVGLYPNRAERLDLRRYSELIYPYTYETPCTWKKETLPFPIPDPARGIRKTHDIMLMFDEPNPSARSFFFKQPLMLSCTQSEFAKTKVLVPIAAKSDEGWTKTIEQYLDFLHLSMLESGGTGYINYFDLPHGFDVAEQRWFHDFGGFGYNNDESMPVLGLWQAWFLTGRQDVLGMARAMTRHTADIDCRHLGKRAGYGSRHNVDHWGCLCYERRISMPLGKRFAYHLLGDRSIVDLAHLTLASFIKEDRKGPHDMTCDIPALVSTLLFLEEIGEVDAEQWLRNIASAIASGIDENGQMTAFLKINPKKQSATVPDEKTVAEHCMFSCFGGGQAFCELAERYDHKPLREAMIRFARFQAMDMSARASQLPQTGIIPLQKDYLNRYRALDLIGYAWQQTADPFFLQAAAGNLEHLVIEIETHQETRYGVSDAGSIAIPVHQPWPDQAKDDNYSHYYPLFPKTSMGQFFNIAVYLHKLQGIMLLATADKE
ncbi:MAG: hypothetical protein HRT89_24205, partial [Lentisphaeria bacterium]|nr:hypothetical protein [Lentisphaeria bacterium]